MVFDKNRKNVLNYKNRYFSRYLKNKKNSLHRNDDLRLEYLLYNNNGGKHASMNILLKVYSVYQKIIK